MNKQNRILFFLLAFGFLVFTSTAGDARAATFTVTKTADTSDGACDADCSLREAIGAANNASTDDVIEFAPAVFNNVQTITLGSGQLVIGRKGALKING